MINGRKIGKFHVSLQKKDKRMTAIVGVLNKHGVALAADSAVTFGNTHKVVNTGNKVFALSKYHLLPLLHMVGVRLWVPLGI